MKTCIITGGSGAIGEGVVRRMAKEMRVVFSYYANEEVAKRIEKETGAMAFFMDAENTKSMEEFVLFSKKQLSHIDHLILASGISQRQLLCDTSYQEAERLLKVNLLSPFYILKLCLPHLRREGASVVLLSSIFGQKGAAMEAVYSASKAGLISLMQALVSEEGASGLRINTICPGAIESPMLEDVPQEERELLQAQSAVGRLGRPEDVANACAFLTSEEASFITGAVLQLDGGYHF